MNYRQRPSISPVVATLFAARVLKRSDRVIDLGCGQGTDCLTLGVWGLEWALGLDSDKAEFERANKRLLRLERKLNRRLKVGFHLGSVTRPHECFPDGSFTVAIDSLLWTNLSSASRPAYAREVARLLRPGGKFIVQARLDARYRIYDAGPPEEFIPPSFFRYFSFGPVVATHIPENARYRRATDRAKAGVALIVGRRRRTGSKS